MNYQVIGLAAIAILLTALVFETRDAPVEDHKVGIAGELADRLDEITAISVTDLASGDGVLLQKQEGWVLQDPPGYPADREAVSRFLVSLSELEIAEAKTARPENHGRLGLNDAGENAAVRIELLPTDWQLLVGRESVNGGHFVRRPEEDQTYLLAQTVAAGTSPLDWVDPVIINVPADRVQSVRISHADGEALVASKDDETGEWQVADLPDGSELRYPSILDSLGRLLVNVRFTDVTSRTGGELPDAAVITVTLDDGEVITLHTAMMDGAYWLDVDREALSGWRYKISEFTYNELTRSIDDLISEDEPGDA